MVSHLLHVALNQFKDNVIKYIFHTSINFRIVYITVWLSMVKKKYGYVQETCQHNEPPLMLFKGHMVKG